MAVRIVSLYRYPVKGLSAEPISSAVLTAGEAMPFDRVYAIENGPGAFDEAAPRHLPKVTYLCQMRDERLATIQSGFNEAQGGLTLSRDGVKLAYGDLRTAEGRTAIEAFFARDMASSLRGRPRVVSACGHSFSDVKEKCLHIINLASLRALEQAAGRTIDPLRFRANVIVDGLEPWAELDWVDRDMTLGTARVHVFKRTVRCAATDVDPANGARRGDLPGDIHAARGHRDFGVYATVTSGEMVQIGDVVRLKE